MTEILREFVDSRGVPMRVDRDAGMVRGVKVLGLSSRNGRTYLPEALRQAIRLYEEAKVNVNHPKGSSTGPRDYQDRIGVIRNVTVRDNEGLFADFHFNPKHSLAEQLAWDAEHSPQNVGFSHNVIARTRRQGNCVVVEAITKVQSVDLVADPATTRGLFESETGGGESESASADPRIRTVDDLKRSYPELVDALCREQAVETHRLKAEIERLQALDEGHRKRLTVRLLLNEYHLPDPDFGDAPAQAIVSSRFIESLLAAENEQVMREMVSERAELVRNLRSAELGQPRSNGRPRSRDQHVLGGPTARDAKAFVEAIT